MRSSLFRLACVLTVALLAGCASNELTIQRGDGDGIGLCAVSEDTLRFGEVAIDGATVVDRIVTLSNQGGALLSGSIAVDDPSFTLIEGGGPFALTPAGTRAVRVRFKPQTRGEHRSDLRLGSICTVRLEGTAVNPGLCVFEPSRLDFGPVARGESKDRTLRLINGGEERLSGELTSPCAEFVIMNNPGPFVLRANESIEFTVRFAPTQLGTAQCLLQTGLSRCTDFTCVAVGEEPPACRVLLPNDNRFGTVVLGESRDLPLVIRNEGGGLLSGIVASPCDEFTIAGDPQFNLDAGAERQFTVTFRPRSTGGKTCTVSLGSACGGVDFVGAGDDPPQCAITTPDGFDLGDVALGSQATRRIVIGNQGGGRLVGVLAVSCAEFSLEEAGTFDLGRGERAEFQMRFAPSSIGEKRCTPSAAGLDCDLPTFRGRGVEPAVCVVEAPVRDFGRIQIGASFNLGFAIRNDGGVRLSGVARVTSGAPTFALTEAEPISYDLAPGARRQFTVAFHPITAGSFDGALDLGTDCGEIAVHGVGEPPPLCTTEPAEELLFGPVVIGSSRELSFDLVNAGGGTLDGAISLSNLCSVFRLLDGDLSFHLGAGERRTFRVAFAPVAEGAFDCRVDLGGVACGSLWVRGVGQAPAECVVDAPIRDFGLVSLGEWKELALTLRNRGGQPLAGTIDLGVSFPVFSIDGQASAAYSIGAGQARGFVLRFTPAAPGARNLTLALGNDLCGVPITFSARGDDPPACALEPSPVLALPTLAVGASDTSSFRVRNVGGGVLRGAVLPPGCAEFALEGSLEYVLSRGQSKRVVVRFTPSAVGSFQCELDPGAGCDPLTLSGEGESAPACAVVSTDGQEFGTVTIGSAAQRHFTIENTGGGTLAGTITEACSDFSVAPTSYSIGAGGTQNFTVTFRPVTIGPRSCTLNLGTACGPLAYTGNGDAAPSCLIAPSNGIINFGTVAVGGSAVQSVTIQNAGGGVLSGTASVVAGPDADQFQLTGSGFYSLNGGQSAVLSLRFAPTSSGSKGAVFDLGNGLCRTVTLDGVGDPPPSCNVSTGELQFGLVAVNGNPSSKVLNFFVENLGGGTLTGAVGNGCGDFAVIAGAGSYALAHGERRQVRVRFTPSQHGVASCGLGVGTGCAEIQLRGTGAISFASTVVPILTDAGSRGCAQGGACHSFGGAIPYWGDYPSVENEVDRANPTNSVLLTKAVGVDHAGGQVWDTSFPEYQQVLTWILEGAVEN